MLDMSLRCRSSTVLSRTEKREGEREIIGIRDNRVRGGAHRAESGPPGGRRGERHPAAGAARQAAGELRPGAGVVQREDTGRRRGVGETPRDVPEQPARAGPAGGGVGRRGGGRTAVERRRERERGEKGHELTD